MERRQLNFRPADQFVLKHMRIHTKRNTILAVTNTSIFMVGADPVILIS